MPGNAVWLVLLTACSGVVDDGRSAFLQETLTRADAPWLAREHRLLADKYARMDGDPYDFLRGTVPLYLADQARLVGDRRQTAFLREPAAGEVLLFGDPHPENTGTGAIGDVSDPSTVEVTFEFVDFDSAAHGPWLIDVRRAALALWTLGEACDVPCREAAVAGLVHGYAVELARLEAGGAPAAPFGAIALGEVDDAREDGPAKKNVGRRTEDGRFVVGPLNDYGEGFLSLDAEDSARADRLLQQLAGLLPPGFRVLDVARRYGQGVSSMPAIRFWVLYDAGSDGPEDDEVLQIREVIDAFPANGLVPAIPGPFESPAQRVVYATTHLQARGGDPLVHALEDGVQSFKVTSVWSWYQDVEHVDITDDLVAGDLAPADLAAFAELLGRRLADGHARAPLGSGGDALPVLLREVDGREEELLAEILDGTRADHALLLADFERFHALIAEHGPWLGADTWLEDVR